MGISKCFLRIGALVLMLGWAVGLALGPIRIAEDRDDQDDSSGRWEGVAMAQMEISDGFRLPTS